MNKNTSGIVVNVSQLDSATVSEMFALMSKYFTELSRTIFEADLSEKDEVILIHSDHGLVGLSTMQFREELVDGHSIGILFSGDTVIDSEYWGTPDLQRCFITSAESVAQSFDGPLYWLLICSGYRTYRYLPIFFREFWPRYDMATPLAIQHLIDIVANRQFGDSYHHGVVTNANGYLRKEISPIEDYRLKNPHVAFFQKMNPRHQQGHELVCFTEISRGNYTRAAMRVVTCRPNQCSSDPR